MDDGLENMLGALALAVVDQLERSATEILKHSGESPAALTVLGYAPGMTNNRLAQILKLSHSATLRLVDRLIDDGLVQRGPGATKRETSLRLTREGERVRARILGERISTLSCFTQPLSPVERKALAQLIRQVLSLQGADDEARYSLCRLCDRDRCPRCPLHAPLSHPTPDAQ